MLQGVDISHHNGNNCLKDVLSKAQIDFVIAKATEGTTFRDKCFDSFMSTAEEFGLQRGAYHYVNTTTLNYASAYAEAANFLSYVRPYGDLLLALDFEEKGLLSQDGVDYLAMIAEYVKEMTGAPPLIYASESVIKQFNFKKCVELGCGLWAAKWKKGVIPIVGDVKQDAYVAASSGQFGITAIQQVSSEGMLGGKKHNIDVDIANMNDLAWSKYANPRL